MHAYTQAEIFHVCRVSIENKGECVYKGTMVYRQMVMPIGMYLFRGFVYKKNDSLPCGKVAYADGVLVFRPLNFDKEESGNRLIMVLDNKTLEVGTIQHFNCKILLHVLPFTRMLVTVFFCLK